MEQQPYPGLQIDENLRQQEREWILQRFAWIVLSIVLLGVTLGLIGNGPLSDTKVSIPGSGGSLEYQRFLRHRTADQLHLTLHSSSDKVRLKLDKHYIKRVSIEKVVPEPEKMIASEDAIIFQFHSTPSESMQATISIHPEKIGRIDGWISIEDQPRQAFSQFVYP